MPSTENLPGSKCECFAVVSDLRVPTTAASKHPAVVVSDGDAPTVGYGAAATRAPTKPEAPLVAVRNAR